jgi:hypothetical protein
VPAWSKKRLQELKYVEVLRDIELGQIRGRITANACTIE